MHLQVRHRRLVLVALLLTAAALAGCAPGTPRPAGPETVDAAAAERFAAAGRPADAADAYARLADRSTGADATRARLRAAEHWWTAGDAERSRNQLDRVDARSLPHADELRAELLAARLALDDGRPAEAAARLSTDLRLLPRSLAADALAVRADANLALGRVRDAVTDLVARERHLDSRADVADNHEAIWRAVRQLDPAQDTGADPVLDGWLALADLRHRAWQDPSGFDSVLAAWRQRFPRHPAAGMFVQRLIDEQRRLAVGVRDVALLLPLGGRFGMAAAAVRDGFIAAHFRNPDASRRPRIRVYDTGDVPSGAVAAYDRAVADGADFIVGPLQRESVAALADHGALAVPVLALNTLDDARAVEHLFQFGLVPEDEAEQIADRAAFEGHRRAVALVPDTDFGIRMLRAFSERFAAHGGELIASELFNPQQQDHSAPIVRALAIDESRERAATLRVVLNTPLHAEPRRRRDADFVFLIASPQQGRSLRPQLRFHHASDLPVYASSLLYGGVQDRSADSDLNGIAFTDMPWTIAPDPATARVQAELSEHLGGAMERDTRLFALGFDAYRLAPVLRHDPSMLREPVPAATGALQLDDGGRIRRSLSWAQFRGGVPRPLAAPRIPAADEPVPIDR